MLEFLLGTDENKKTEYIYSRALNDAKSGRSAFILVPEQYSMYAESELISKLGLSAQNKIQIITFSRLSNMIFSKLGPLRIKYIDKAGKYLLACRSMQLLRKNLSYFSNNVSQNGFSHLLVSAISEFKRYGLSPSDLLATSQKFEGTPLSLKLNDLSKIYEKFNSLLEENQSNAEDNLKLSLEKIPKADFLNGNLYISYFRSFTPVEYEAILMLMKKMDVIVSLCLDSLSDTQKAFFTQKESFKKLSSMARELGIKVNTPSFFNEESPVLEEYELFHLKTNYFSPKPKALKESPKTVHILTPQNYYAEVQNAARLIRRLCRLEGYSFSDFLILTGSMEKYSLVLPSVFEDAEISFFMDQKISILENPFMRMITSVLEILAFGFSYSRIMGILRSGFFDIPKEDIDYFENYILAATPSYKEWQTFSDWTFNPNRASFDMDRINGIKALAVHPILNLISSFSGRKTIGDIISHLTSWLNSIDISSSVSKKIEEFKNENKPHLSEYLESVWNAFVSLTAQIFDCFGDAKATFAEFYEIFTSSISELSLSIVPPNQDKVLISEIQAFRSAGAKVVIVLGTVDGVFPASQNSEGIISDTERLKLKDAGVILAPDNFTKQKEDQFLIYSVFSAAKKHLYLSSPQSDSDGKSLGGSEIIKHIKTHIFPNIVPEKDDSEIDLIEGKNTTFSILATRLFECDFDPSKLSSLWQSVYDYFKNLPEFSEKLDFFKDINQKNKEPDKISPSLAKKLYGEPLSLSVSKLEKYNACAFSFFMKYGLFAEERLLGGLKATDLGTILHDILFRYFKEKSKTNTDYQKITRDDCFSEISSIVNDIAKDAENPLFASSNYYQYMLLRLKNIASSTAWKLVGFYSNSSFRPTGFEVSFGKNGVLPPYEIKTEKSKVILKGFIDRVDSAKIDGKEYIMVTDYKSSEKRLDPQMIDAGITIQPFIYANAVANAGEERVPAGMMYLQMNDPIVSFDSLPDDKTWEAEMNSKIKAHGIFLDDPDVLLALDKDMEDKTKTHYISCDQKSRLIKELFEKRLSDAEKCAAQTADKIADGIIDANPPKISGFDPCQYCPYKSICEKA